MGRLALVKHFIEERGIPVNTITADEMQFLVGCETDKDSVMLQTPLFSALESNEQEMINYLLDHMEKEEVDNAFFGGTTAL